MPFSHLLRRCCVRLRYWCASLVPACASGADADALPPSLPFLTSPILFGAPHTHAGFFGGTIALGSFKAAYGLNADNSSNTSANLVSLFQAGSFFGAGLQLPMTTRLGRKWSIVISNLIFIVSAIVQTFANGS